MDQILTEKDLMTNGNCWGQWTFSLPDEKISEKIASLPQLKQEENCSHWVHLFSATQRKSDAEDVNVAFDIIPSASLDNHSPVKQSQVFDNSHASVASGSVEELSNCLVDLCNQLGPKLRFGLPGIQAEIKGLEGDLKNLKSESLVLLMEKAWPQIQSDSGKFCFCIPFCASTDQCETLCKRILLPWLSKHLPSKLEQLSTVLSEEGETVCVSLLAPLLRMEESPLVHDLMSFEDLMSSMTPKHWTILLREFLSGLGELQKWQVPALATVVQHAQPTCDDLFVLVQLMSLTGSTFTQSREFGALLVAVANHLKTESSSLVPQLKLIANNYKGSLKFKALKILADVS